MLVGLSLMILGNVSSFAMHLVKRYDTKLLYEAFLVGRRGIIEDDMNLSRSNLGLIASITPACMLL